MSWLTITLVVVFASFLLAYGFTEWLARRERERFSPPRANDDPRAPSS